MSRRPGMWDAIRKFFAPLESRVDSLEASGKSASDHGTISDNTDNVAERTFSPTAATNHSYTTAGSHTQIYAGIDAAHPSMVIEFKVTATTTITIPNTAIIFTTQNLTSLAAGTYVMVVLRLVEDATYSEAVYVSKKP